MEGTISERGEVTIAWTLSIIRSYPSSFAFRSSSDVKGPGPNVSTTLRPRSVENSAWFLLAHTLSLSRPFSLIILLASSNNASNSSSLFFPSSSVPALAEILSTIAVRLERVLVVLTWTLHSSLTSAASAMVFIIASYPPYMKISALATFATSIGVISYSGGCLRSAGATVSTPSRPAISAMAATQLVEATYLGVEALSIAPSAKSPVKTMREISKTVILLSIFYSPICYFFR